MRVILTGFVASAIIAFMIIASPLIGMAMYGTAPVHAQDYANVSCQELWYARNEIFARKGHCFKSPKAQAEFGKGCFPPYGKLSRAERIEVRRIRRLEASRGCSTKAVTHKRNRRGLLKLPIVIGGDPDYDACGGNGEIVGLDPRGDGYLSVRSSPRGKEIDRVFNGQLVYICNERGKWMGVVYPGSKQYPEECNVSTPWTTRMPYTGPCRYGWVFSKYVKVIAG